MSIARVLICGARSQLLDDLTDAARRAEVAPATGRHAQHAQVGGAAFEQIAGEIELGQAVVQTQQRRPAAGRRAGGLALREADLHLHHQRRKPRHVQVQQRARRGDHDEGVPQSARIDDFARDRVAGLLDEARHGVAAERIAARRAGRSRDRYPARPAAGRAVPGGPALRSSVRAPAASERFSTSSSRT